MAQKRQGNRFAQTARLDDPSSPPGLPLEIVEAKRAMPAGRNFH